MVRKTGQENNCLKNEIRSLNKQLQSSQEAEKVALEGLNSPVEHIWDLLRYGIGI